MLSQPKWQVLLVVATLFVAIGKKGSPQTFGLDYMSAVLHITFYIIYIFAIYVPDRNFSATRLHKVLDSSSTILITQRTSIGMLCLKHCTLYSFVFSLLFDQLLETTNLPLTWIRRCTSLELLSSFGLFCSTTTNWSRIATNSSGETMHIKHM